jgi:hypothetical protein
VHNELKIILKEAVVAYYEALPQDLSVATKKNYKKYVGTFDFVAKI